MSDTETKAAADSELLVIRCQLGEREAFDELIVIWHSPLWRFVRRMISDDQVAQDVLQDAWLRILRGIDRLAEPSRLAPWLFTIARRAVMDRLRRQYAEPEHTDVADEPLAAPEASELAFEETEILNDAMASLPPRERESIALFYIQELDLRQIADVLAVPLGTVKSRLHRARRLLRQRLEAQGVYR